MMVAIRQARSAPVAVPNKSRGSSPISPEPHSILILINAADDSAPSIWQVTPIFLEDRDAHPPHLSTGIPQKDRSRIVGAAIHLWRVRALGAMWFAEIGRA